MKKLLLLFVLPLFVSCYKDTYEWRMDQLPITDQERVQIDEHVRSVMGIAREQLSLAGHDQDFEEYVRVVYAHANEIVCKPRMFEYCIEHGPFYEEVRARRTGKWKEINEQKN